jgi:hypothetical protein
MWTFSPLIEFIDSNTELSTELYSKAQNLLVLKLDGLQFILKGNMFWDQHLLGWFIPYSSLEGRVGTQELNLDLLGNTLNVKFFPKRLQSLESFLELQQ